MPVSAYARTETYHNEELFKVCVYKAKKDVIIEEVGTKVVYDVSDKGLYDEKTGKRWVKLEIKPYRVELNRFGEIIGGGNKEFTYVAEDGYWDDLRMWLHPIPSCT